MMLTFLPLLTQPQSKESSLSPEVSMTGETSTPGGVAVPTAAGTREVEGVVAGEESDAAFPRLLDDSRENADGLTFDLLGHTSHHGDEAGLELGL